MRITTQMLEQSAAKSGIPLNSTSLLDIMNDSSSGNLFTNVSNNNTSASSILKKNYYTKLEQSTDELSQSTAALLGKDQNSLFTKAEEDKDTSAIVKDVKSMVENYNAVQKQLASSGDTLSNFYKQQMTQISEESKEVLKNAGITTSKDGTLVIDEKALAAADIDTLKKAFGPDTTFASKLNYISEKISNYAEANRDSLSSQYGSNGLSYSSAFEASKYDFLG